MEIYGILLMLLADLKDCPPSYYNKRNFTYVASTAEELNIIIN